MPHTYEYPRPMVTVDAAVFTVRNERLEILLIRRGNDPYKGSWALPGGFLEMDEELETAATRELEEETGVRGVNLAYAGVFGKVGRDPRGRVITVTFAGLTDWRLHAPKGADDAAEAQWFPVDALPAMAFDHENMVAQCTRWLRAHQGADLPGALSAGS